MSARPFWETVPLAAMSRTQWESLCDGCGRCCVHKLEDEETGELLPTNVACRLLDGATGRCKEGLAEWHPLVSGNPDSVHKAGISVKGWTISEDIAGPLENHIIDDPL